MAYSSSAVNKYMNTVPYKMASKNVRWRHNLKWSDKRNINICCYGNGICYNSYVYNEATYV